MDAADFLLRALHAGIQRHRPAGHLAPAALERRRASGRSADSRAFWRRSDAAPPGRATRAGASVGRKTAAGARGRLSSYPQVSTHAEHSGLDERFDPFSESYLSDPYEFFAEARAATPVFYSARLKYW